MNITDLFGSYSLAFPDCLSLLVVTLFNSLFSVKDIQAGLAPNFMNSIDEIWNRSSEVFQWNFAVYMSYLFRQLMTRLFSTPVLNAKTFRKGKAGLKKEK